MTDRLPHFATAALALALAFLAFWYGYAAIAFVAAVIATVAFFAAVFSPPQFIPPRGNILSIGSAHLPENDFCRHGIVVGQPGVGKTEFARRLLIQLVRNAPDFGARDFPR